MSLAKTPARRKTALDKGSRAQTSPDDCGGMGLAKDGDIVAFVLGCQPGRDRKHDTPIEQGIRLRQDAATIGALQGHVGRMCPWETVVAIAAPLDKSFDIVIDMQPVVR